jgi:hypothetical protein
MDFEHYNKMLAAINSQLEAIADMTQAQALTGCANSDNALFVTVMAQHKRLTDTAAMLNDRALRAVGIIKE